MEEHNAHFPELILIDATYKLNNLSMPLYIMMVVDGNGESEVIALWLVVREDKTTIGHLMNIFIKCNDTSSTGCIMADKDFTEREIFAEKIPDAELMICLFHTLHVKSHLRKWVLVLPKDHCLRVNNQAGVCSR